MNKTRVRLAALLLAVSFALSGCSLVKNIGGSSGAGTKTITRPAVESAELQFTHPAAGEPVAVFDTTAGVFRAVLFPEQAPQAYDNFVGLVQAGYYNGLTVTRVEQDFVVEAGQGADGKGTTIWNGSRYPAEATTSSTIIRCPLHGGGLLRPVRQRLLLSCPLCRRGVPSPRNSLTR